ncbi:ribokinase [Halobacillus salinus]|uniref:Ribokinase n=1 Tax=Halobacillus salinus TaxID=192814 RepID=A0A4Z0GW28_9BACI|nr:ribokinase [Halobacillus salinus]TGB01207.1 ribokinase [Halobacillus salinus]
MSRVTVFGSINMDLTVTTKVMPEQGETVLGEQFATYPGGKGANQAVAAARIGTVVRMIGVVGDDVFGKDLLNHLSSEGVDTGGIYQLSGMATGTATIIVNDHDNRIIVAPGANHGLTPEMVYKQESLIEQCDVLLVQLEIPIETIGAVAVLAEKHEILLIVNPAPYQKLPETFLERASFVTPNETEARMLTADDPWVESKLITTKGKEGVSILVKGEQITVQGYPVEPVDTTGAGDTFNGALAAKLSAGTELNESVAFANAAAALSVMKPGAQSGMPTTKQVLTFLQEQDNN